MSADNAASIQPQTIPAQDGFPLGVTVFPAQERSAGANTPVLLLNSAVAVPQTFYRPFAEYIAGQGVPVVTYDYRGVGRSRPAGSLRGMAGSLRDWALNDVTAALAWTAAQFPGRRIVALGHSFGGQCLGLLPNRHLIHRSVLVASQVAYWKAYDARDRRRVWFAVHVLMPGLSHAFGYFPGSKVGFGEDLPKGVGLEWAKWCRSPHYLFDHLTPEERAGYDTFSAPMLAFKFTDDVMASGDTVEQLLAFYRKARPVLRTVDPRELGVQALGHIGFFRPRAGQALWPEVLRWAQAPHVQQSAVSA